MYCDLLREDERKTRTCLEFLVLQNRRYYILRRVEHTLQHVTGLKCHKSYVLRPLLKFKINILTEKK